MKRGWPLFVALLKFVVVCAFGGIFYVLGWLVWLAWTLVTIVPTFPF